MPSKGRSHQGKHYRWSHFFDSSVLDPDFDDDDRCLTLLQHEVTSVGAMPLHPDGDRRSTDIDPVPLCSHVPDGGDSYSSEFPDIRLQLKQAHEHHAKLAAKEAERKRRSDERRAANRAAGEARIENERLVQYEAIVQQRNFPSPPTWEQELLRNMRLNEPIRAHCGRVYQDYVMINESDEGEANPEAHNVMWTEVLRCRGFIIYKRRVVGDMYIGNAM
jgi:hypothetical protein